MREPLESPNMDLEKVVGDIVESYVHSNIGNTRRAFLTDYFQERGSKELDEAAIKRYDHDEIGLGSLEEKLQPFMADLYDYVTERIEDIQKDYERDKDLRESQKTSEILNEFNGDEGLDSWLEIEPGDQSLYFSIKTPMGRAYTEKYGLEESEIHIESLAANGNTYELTSLLTRLNDERKFDMLDRYSEIIANKDREALSEAVTWKKSDEITDFQKKGWKIMLRNLQRTLDLDKIDENDIY